MRAGNTKLIVDDVVYNVLKLEFGLHRNANLSGRPVGGHQDGSIYIEIESTAQTDLYRWVHEIEMKENVRIEIYPLEMNSNMRTINLYDVVCFSYHEYFKSTGTTPLVTQIKLMPATIVDRGAKVFERNWKRTDWQQNNSGNEHTPNNEDEEPLLLEGYFIDETGNRIAETEPGQRVKFVVKSQNMVGSIIDIDFSDDDVDYLHNGIYLENDLLENIQVSANEMEIELKTIKQR